jgi:hypothetical protein
MSPDEVSMWTAYFVVRGEKEEKAIKDAKRKRGRR